MPRNQRARSIALVLGALALAAPIAALQHHGQHDHAAAASAGGGGRVRTYYISADEVEWDYAPHRRNDVTGRPFGPVENVFVEQGPHRIGRRYLKAIYRQYTDASFRRLARRAPEDAYMGILGPTIFAAVGDTVVVHFRNATRFPTGVHPHGVFYDKANEGAPYVDGTGGAAKADDAVPPDGTYTYRWTVPERAGPGPMDPSSVAWMYHGHTDEVGDTYAGLVGAIVVTARGKARPDGTPKGVDRNLVALFSVFDENQSPYLEENIRRFAGDPERVDPEDEEFVESNLMHSVNGYVYGNMSVPTLRTGAESRWYLLDLGTEVDMHTPHWHGNTAIVNGMRTDVAQLLAGGMATAVMDPDDPGTWLFHCHVNDHLTAGMVARYRVV